MKNYIFTFSLLLATGLANAQYFHYLYGTPNAELLSGDGHHAYQGGTVSHFITSPFQNGPFPPMGTSLVAERINTFGTTLPYFNRTYQHFNPFTSTVVNINQAKSIEFPGGGFAVVGNFNDPSTGVDALYYTQLNGLTGAVMGCMQYFPAAPFAYTTLRVTSVAPSVQSPGEFYVCGEITDALGQTRVFALKLLQAGGIVWSWIYDLNMTSTTHKELPSAILESAQINPIVGTYEVMIVGSYNDLAPSDGFVFRVDHLTGLVTQNTQTYGTPTLSENFSAIKNSSNPNVAGTQDGYVLCGSSETFIPGSSDVWNVAIDQPGNVIWSNLFDYNNSGPTNNLDEGVDLIERLLVGATNTYEYYIVSQTSNGFYGMTDVVVTKLDGNGNAVPMGQFTYGEIMQDGPWSIDETSCTQYPGISIYAYTFDPVNHIGGIDHRLITAQYNGVTACNYNLQNLIQTPGPGNLSNFPGNAIHPFVSTQLLCSILAKGSEQKICTPNTAYFQSFYGTPLNDNLSDGHNVLNNTIGHCLVGTTDAFSLTSFDLEVQRTDELGNAAAAPYFNNIYNFNSAGNPLSVGASRSVEFSNGTGFGISGSFNDLATGTIGLYFLNIDALGNIIGSTGFTVPPGPFAYQLQVVSIKESVQNPNELYITGHAYFANLKRLFVLKITNTGLLLWSQIYDLDITLPDNNIDEAADLVESAFMNGGTYELLIVGQHINNGTTDAFILRVDYLTGAVIGNIQLYGGPFSRDIFTSIKNSANPLITPAVNGYIIAGSSNDNPGGDMDFWLMGVDQAGFPAWSTLFDYNNLTPVPNHEECYDVIERLNSCGDYEYYMAGYTSNGVFLGEDAVVIKADALGNGVPNGQFTYGSSMQERALRIDQFNGTTNDGIAVYGRSPGNTPFGNDHYLVKAYFNGVTACQFDLRNTVQSPGPSIFATPTPTVISSLVNIPVSAIMPLNAGQTMLCFANSIATGDNRKVAPAASGKKEADASGLTELVVFPNPAPANGSAFDMKLISDIDQQATVVVMDLLGRQFYNGSFQLTKGANSMQLLPQGTHLAKGTYFVNIRTATDTKKVILVVQ